MYCLLPHLENGEFLNEFAMKYRLALALLCMFNIVLNSE